MYVVRVIKALLFLEFVLISGISIPKANDFGYMQSKFYFECAWLLEALSH